MSKRGNELRNYLRDSICWVLGHLDIPSEDKPGWSSIYCGRCGKEIFKPYPWQKIYEKIRWSIPRAFLYLANKTYPRGRLIHYPAYRAVDQHLDGVGGEHSCGAYSYEYLESLVEQDGPDGFGATATIAWLIGEDGWININEDNAEEVVAMINKDFEEQSNKAERERNIRIMNGEEVRKDYEQRI